jgi:hypothetical protein
MQVIKYFYLEGDRQWLGYPENFPEHWAQGETFETLQLNLYRLNFDLTLLEALRNTTELSLP